MPEDDCFHKMAKFFETDKEAAKVQAKMSVLHSRFAEVRRQYQIRGDQSSLGIPEDHAHPNFDTKSRIALFHNGQIANQDEIIKELAELGQTDLKKKTDSQLITALLGAEMDSGADLKTALKNVVEQKLLGTYRIAVMLTDSPGSILFVKNSGDLVLGSSKNNEEIVVSSDPAIL